MHSFWYLEDIYALYVYNLSFNDTYSKLYVINGYVRDLVITVYSDLLSV